MAGEHEARLVSGLDEPATETTGIALPPVAHAPTARHALSTEELAAISALPSGSALLIAHSGPNQGARFLLDQEITQAGRHPEVDVFLDDVTVSRKHAQFRRTADGFLLVDSGSLNGTYVNQDRVDSVRLVNGAEVQIGKFRLTFYVGSPQPSAATGD